MSLVGLGSPKAVKAESKEFKFYRPRKLQTPDEIAEIDKLKEIDKKINELTKEAVLGNHDAQRCIAKSFQEAGQIIFAKAWNWLEVQTAPESKTEIKEEKGQAVKVDKNVAYKWARLYEQAGREGRNANLHFSLARAWCFHAAELGHVDAQCRTAVWCDEGYYGDAYRGEAASMYYQEVEHLQDEITEIDTLFDLAKAHENGKVRKNKPEENLTKAFELYVIAAALGNKNACNWIRDNIQAKKLNLPQNLTNAWLSQFSVPGKSQK